MKRIFVLILAAVVIFSSCGEGGAFSPMIVVPPGYTVSDGEISAKLVNVYFFDPYSEIYCENGEMYLYDDAAHTNVFEGGVIELLEGENVFYIAFEGDGGGKEYKLTLDCMMILDFSVEILRDKTYSVGEPFDRSTVRVTAKKDSGGTAEIDDYGTEYDFSTAGEKRVSISFGGIVHFIKVNVK